MTREYYSFGLTSLYFFSSITYYFLNALYPCNVILYINAPVRIYGATYYSTATTSDIVVINRGITLTWRSPEVE